MKVHHLAKNTLIEFHHLSINTFFLLFQSRNKSKVMVALVFVFTLLMMPVCGRNLFQDVAPPKHGLKQSLTRFTNKQSFPGEQVVEPLSRKHVKKMLSKAVLKPWQLPKLSFTDVRLESGNTMMANRDKQNKPDIRSKSRPLATGGFFGLPKLTASEPKSYSVADAGASNMNVLGGGFGFLIQQTKPTWLMRTEELAEETCRMNVYNQTIKSKGCKSIIMPNSMCTGRCNSFFVPASNADFQSCSSCFPSRVSEQKVILECPKRKRGFKVKKIQVILECKCQSMMSCSPVKK